MGHKVFVVGTGRSGTHWLGWILDDHADVRSTIEKPAIFKRVTAAAIDPRVRERNLRYLRLRYTWEHLRTGPRRHYVDKSHPNLWHVEVLTRHFPDARFIAMRRDVNATVASMLKHEGVMAWHRRWREFPVPNQFLGITDENVEIYGALSPAAQCALRWKAHADRIDRLSESMPADRFLVVDYERMAAQFDTETRRIWEFVGLDPQPSSITVKSTSVEKWRDELTPTDLADIESVTAP